VYCRTLRSNERAHSNTWYTGQQKAAMSHIIPSNDSVLNEDVQVEMGMIAVDDVDMASPRSSKKKQEKFSTPTDWKKRLSRHTKSSSSPSLGSKVSAKNLLLGIVGDAFVSAVSKQQTEEGASG
jgi:hypothetical protein